MCQSVERGLNQEDTERGIVNINPKDNTGALVGTCKTEAGTSTILPASVTFTMPVPPSVNQAYRNTKRGRAKTKSYTDWLLYAYQMIRMQKVQKISGRCIVIIGVERESLAADIDNRIKLALDAIVSADIIDDDRFVTAIALTWVPEANGLCHIQILPIQPLRLQFHPSSDGATGAWINSAPQQETR